MTYREVIVKGDEDVLRGFLGAFKAGTRITRGLVHCHNLPIKTSHLREVLSGKFHREHLIVSTRHHKALVSAINRADSDLGIEITRDRKIRKLYFAFSLKTFNREVGNEVNRVLNRPPAGVTFSSVKMEERIDPKAKGVEMYAPAHEYELSGKGRVSGDLQPLLRLHERMRENEWIDVEDITLVF